MKPPVIEVEHVSLGQNGQVMLEDISLTVREHEFHAIIGPNGGGKTTLLKVILGLIRPDSGTVRVLGGTPHEMRVHLGYVPQFRTFDFQFPISVQDMVASGRLGHLAGPFQRFTREDEDAADEAMETMQITHLKDRPIHDISGGERQRAIIARALAGRPSVLLLDEPTVYVDSPTAVRFYDILSRLRESMTIVLVTHDISALSPDVTHISCVNRRLFTHHDNQITDDMIQGAYPCPVDLIAHGVPHRVIPDHENRVFGGRK
ncbi:ABC transporter ATP-binding protein [Methanogenium sp. S4BF]|uniref:metal ABC transporter ATP-binding protein n=1 Tax=Methanogenium sp. S4BF TaxID=1789226 RepID=UPI002417B37A|nr:ABC transporter ATP-binding protein [Methanogenium sp. S4BF]WFN33588.1 ABC transporter ATP-binding protein [Methanogenium sp. S4BF]